MSRRGRGSGGREGHVGPALGGPPTKQESSRDLQPHASGFGSCGGHLGKAREEQGLTAAVGLAWGCVREAGYPSARWGSKRKGPAVAKQSLVHQVGRPRSRLSTSSAEPQHQQGFAGGHELGKRGAGSEGGGQAGAMEDLGASKRMRQAPSRAGNVTEVGVGSIQTYSDSKTAYRRIPLPSFLINYFGPARCGQQQQGRGLGCSQSVEVVKKS